MARGQAEEKELAELRREKRMQGLEAITEFLDDTGISVEEARAVLERHALEMQEQLLEDENQESELSEVS